MVTIAFGQVMHRRLRPVSHGFAYPVFFLRIPLGELAGPGANENKVVELRDGRLLLSSRAKGCRLQAVSTDGLWNKLAGNIRQPMSYRECADEYLRLVA